MADSKAAQDAEARARAESGNDPALNAAAVDVVDDGARGDPGSNQPPRQAGDPEQRQPPSVRAKFDDKRAEIINRFRGHRDQQQQEDRDEVSDFARSGLPPEWGQDQQQDQQEEIDQDAQGAVDTAGQQQEPSPPPKIKLKVRGEEKEYSLDEVIANAQKALAADNYLDEAKGKLKEIDDLLRSTRDRAPRPGQNGEHPAVQNGAQPTDPQQGPNGDQPQHPEDKIAKLIETLQFGDPEEAKSLLRNTIAETANEVVEQSLQSQRLSDEGARAAKVLKDFEDQHPEIAKDKRARAAIEADVLDLQIEDIKALGIDPDRIRPDGQPPTPGDIALAHRWYRSKGFQVRSPQQMLETASKNFLEWKGVKTPEPNPADPGNKAPPRVEVTVDRAARRQAIPQQPSLSGAKPRAPAQAPAQPRDRSSIVQDMMANRNKPRGRIVA